MAAPGALGHLVDQGERGAHLRDDVGLNAAQVGRNRVDDGKDRSVNDDILLENLEVGDEREDTLALLIEAGPLCSGSGNTASSRPAGVEARRGFRTLSAASSAYRMMTLPSGAWLPRKRLAP